jgi:hypothetical protein
MAEFGSNTAVVEGAGGSYFFTTRKRLRDFGLHAPQTIGKPSFSFLSAPRGLRGLRIAANGLCWRPIKRT